MRYHVNLMNHFISFFSMKHLSKIHVLPLIMSHHHAPTCWVCPMTSQRSWQPMRKKRGSPVLERGIMKNVWDWQISSKIEIWSAESFHFVKGEIDRGRRGKQRTKVGWNVPRMMADGDETEKIDDEYLCNWKTRPNVDLNKVMDLTP